MGPTTPTLTMPTLPVQPTIPGMTGGLLCSDTCQFANDMGCDDGGEGSEHTCNNGQTCCDLGTDCADCGKRVDPVSRGSGFVPEQAGRMRVSACNAHGYGVVQATCGKADAWGDRAAIACCGMTNVCEAAVCDVVTNTYNPYGPQINPSASLLNLARPEEATFADAEAECATRGLRLCSAEELANSACCTNPLGCDVASRKDVWSTTPCPPAAEAAAPTAAPASTPTVDACEELCFEGATCKQLITHGMACDAFVAAGCDMCTECSLCYPQG